MSTDNHSGSNGFKPKMSMVFNEDKSIDTYVQTTRDGRKRKVPRTEEEIERFFPEYKPEQAKADSLSEEILALYKKAIQDANSLTTEEMLFIQDWVPEAVVDERCRKRCGTTWEELIATAIERPQELTPDDVLFLDSGRSTTYKDSQATMRRISGKGRLPEPARTLWAEARNAFKDPKYARAKSNVEAERDRIRGERAEALSHLSEDDKQNIVQSTHIPWITRLMESEKPQWGLVCFRTTYGDEEAWEKYTQHLLRSSCIGMRAHSGTEFLRKKWHIQFIEDDKERLEGASLEDLCTYFKTPPSSSPISSCISSGLRSDAFLFADARAVSSMNDPAFDCSKINLYPPPGAPPWSTEHLISGYVCAVDAAYDSSQTHAHGFEGILKIHPAHVATTFYHKLIPRDQEEEDSEKWWTYKQDWETMYKVANGDYSRPGGIYPPKWTWNRGNPRKDPDGRTIQGAY